MHERGDRGPGKAGAGGADGEERRGRAVVFSGGGTGGHLYPALALADVLRRIRPDVRALFVGARRGLEARVLPERGEEHLLLPVVGFRRGIPLWKHAGALLPLARALSGAVGFLRKTDAEVVVVTGGYAGAPAGLGAVLLGIPLVVQEQNAEPGLVTRMLSRWARQVHLAFPEAGERLSPRARERARVSGNPVRVPESGAETPSGGIRVRARQRTAGRETFGLSQQGPVVLVVGGSQGSAALNEAVVEAILGVEAGRLRRPEGVQLLWSTGPTHLASVRDRLAGSGPGWIRTLGFIDDMPAALAASDLAVSRAGAMATSEFLAWGLPSILVPLPTAAADHQTRNAVALAEAGAAVHLPESTLSGESLIRRIGAVVGEPGTLDAMAEAARARGRPRASQEIAQAIAELLPEPVAGSAEAGGRP